MMHDSGEKLRPGSYAFLEDTPSDDAQRRVGERYGRRNPVLAAEQFELTEQRTAFLPVDDRSGSLIVLDEELDLAFEHDKEAGGIITLMEEMIAAPVTPDHSLLEEEIAIVFRQYHDPSPLSRPTRTQPRRCLDHTHALERQPVVRLDARIGRVDYDGRRSRKFIDGIASHDWTGTAHAGTP
jgi:hypothetical protein